MDHARYFVDLDFSNIKRFGFQYEADLKDRDCYDLEVMIELKLPALCRKRFSFKDKRSCTNKVKSPFNMHGQNLFLNYWNLNQCFYLRGKANERDFKKFMQTFKQAGGAQIDSRLQAGVMERESAFGEVQALLRRSVNLNAKID